MGNNNKGTKLTKTEIASYGIVYAAIFGAGARLFLSFKRKRDAEKRFRVFEKEHGHKLSRDMSMIVNESIRYGYSPKDINDMIHKYNEAYTSMDEQRCREIINEFEETLKIEKCSVEYDVEEDTEAVEEDTEAVEEDTDGEDTTPVEE